MNEKIKLLQQKVAEQPENAHLLYLLGMAYCDEKMFSEARDIFTDAMMNAEGEFLSVVSAAAAQAAVHETASAGTSSSANAQTATELARKRITFADVGGMDSVKSAIDMKIIQPMLHPDLFAQFGQKMGGGILLYGPPGCGKTYIARASAGECNAKFINLRITDVLDKWIGESERNLENVFIKARSQRPAIIFIDEMDMLGYSRTKGGGDTMRGVVDLMLSEMEGVASDNEGILIIGASNMPWDIDSALKRPGRFDKTIFVSPPDKAARATIFKIHTSGLPVEKLDYDELATCSEFFSGADIVSVAKQTSEAVLKEILAGGAKRKIGQKDMLSAINATRPSTLEWLRTMSDYIRYSNTAGLYDDVRDYLEEHKGNI